MSESIILYFRIWSDMESMKKFRIGSGLQNFLIRTNCKVVLRPVAQLYGQVRIYWNQCFVIDCSLSHPAGHKPFTCSHSVLRNM